MICLMEAVATYLAAKLSLRIGEEIVIAKMPDTPAACICVYDDTRVISNATLVPQIDAEYHLIRVRVRDTSFMQAFNRAQLACGYLQTSDEHFPQQSLSTIETTGVVTLAENFDVMSFVVSQPGACPDDINQLNERAVEFTCRMITRKLY